MAGFGFDAHVVKKVESHGVKFRPLKKFVFDVDDELDTFDADWAFVHFNRHIREYLKNENNSFVLYRLAENIDYVRLKPEFIDAVCLDAGLNHMGGIYQVCRYGYQEYCLEDFTNLNKAMNNILEGKRR